MKLASIRRTYKQYSGYYDAVFGPLLSRGRRLAIETANDLPGDRLLEVGVGTGLSLPKYRRSLAVTGIDISPEMLDKARQRVAAASVNHIQALVEMDAEQLEFADESFDIVVAMYVASVSPNPAKLLKELQRVCAGGGHIVIVNHFASRHGPRAFLERRLAPLSNLLGWRPDFKMEDLLNSNKLDIIDEKLTGPLGLFTILTIQA